MKVINFFAGPGSGKSTTAAGLFFLMKSQGINVELVTEFAKQLIWQERHATFSDQLYILAKQNNKLFSLNGKVDYAITDSPLLLSNIYAPKDYVSGFAGFVERLFNTYSNINIFIKRIKPYNPIGRNQKENDAKSLDVTIKTFLNNRKIPFFEVNGDKEAPNKIFNLLSKVKTNKRESSLLELISCNA